MFRKHYAKAIQALPDVQCLSPHRCRHTDVSQLQAVSVGIETIQRLSGHTSVAMLRHYQSVDYDDLRRITNVLCIKSPSERLIPRGFFVGSRWGAGGFSQTRKI